MEIIEIIKMKKIFSRKMLAVTAIFFIAAISILLANSLGMTGFFSKAFDKSLSPAEQYEKNITIRQYYNLTIRFQKETSSTTYLTFDSNDTAIILKDLNGTEIARATGLINGKAYFLVNRQSLDRVATISALNLGDYEDVVDQQANKTFSGTTAYITVKVHGKPPQPARIFGIASDELTGTVAEGVTVAAFEDGADPTIASSVNSSITDINGHYSMQFDLNATKALDVYVKDYEAS